MFDRVGRAVVLPAMAASIGMVLLGMVLGCQPAGSGTGSPGFQENRVESSSLARSPGSGGGGGSGGQSIEIVTTCAMVTDIVRQVAGERATVTGLLGEGVDPHLYKPTRSDVKRLLEADLVFYSGLHLEGRMTQTFEKIAAGGKPVWAVTAGIEEASLLHPGEGGGHPDPHVWMDVRAWGTAVGFVAEKLAEFDEASAAPYRERAAAYRRQLDQLDEYARRSIASIPAEQRVLVTAHDAFGYFSRAYQIEVRPVQGISTESQAGVDDINQLVKFLVERRVRAIFVESSVSSKNIQAIVEGARQHGHQVAIGGELYSDAMGPTGTYEGTYLGMLDHNVTTIARALGGTAPERGWQGKLAARK